MQVLPCRSRPLAESAFAIAKADEGFSPRSQTPHRLPATARPQPMQSIGVFSKCGGRRPRLCHLPHTGAEELPFMKSLFLRPSPPLVFKRRFRHFGSAVALP